jgi:hypothetical protein
METERLVNYNWPSMVRASKWAQLLHALATVLGHGERKEREHKEPPTFHGFRGKLPKGSLLSARSFLH